MKTSGGPCEFAFDYAADTVILVFRDDDFQESARVNMSSAEARELAKFLGRFADLADERTEHMAKLKALKTSTEG